MFPIGVVVFSALVTPVSFNSQIPNLNEEMIRVVDIPKSWVCIVDKIWLSKDVYEESKMAPDSGDDALRGGDMEKIFKPNIEANPKGKEPYNGNEWVYFVKTLFSLVPYIFVTWLFILLVSARRENELLKARVQLAKFRLERLIRYFTRQQTAPPPD